MNLFDWKDGASGFVQAGGKQLECASWGPSPSDAPTLVLLHEGLGCVALWRDFPDKLAASTGFGVFAYSRAGYGQSDLAELPRPVDYMTREAKGVLHDVLDAAGIRKCILIGHSDGATIAAEYVGNVFDARVRGLVLMAPHFFAEQEGLSEIKKVKELFATTDLKQKMAKYHRDPEVAFRGWNDGWLNPLFADWDVSDVIDQFRIPVLGIQGVDDQYGTLAQINIIEERSYAPVELAVLEDCGHSPFLEQPDITLAQITRFVQRIEAFEADPDKAA